MIDEPGFMSLDNWQLIGAEYQNAVEKHGPRFATLPEGLDALLEELAELVAAAAKGDIDGPHGARREMAQIVVIGVKILEGFKDGSIQL